MQQESDDPRGTPVALYSLPLLFLTWPLSYGPFFLLYQQGMISQVTLANLESTVYFPWVWLYDNTDFFKALGDWYLTFW